MLAKFNKAFVSFERDAYSLLHECHFDPAKELESFEFQIQAQNLATDLGYFAMVMCDLHQIAVLDISSEMDRDNVEYDRYLKEQLAKQDSSLVLDEKFFRNQPKREQKINIALAKFGAAYKAFLFVVRAYQDSIYKVALRIGGQAVRGESSMADAIHRETRMFVLTNPFGKLLANDVPEYPVWFCSLRAQRNFIKCGAGVSYHAGKNFLSGETTMAINIHMPSETMQPRSE